MQSVLDRVDENKFKDQWMFSFFFDSLLHLFASFELMKPASEAQFEDSEVSIIKFGGLEAPVRLSSFKLLM